MVRFNPFARMLPFQMPANVEIKARVRDLDQLVRNAERLSGSPGTVILQTDTFFPVPHGRLKLRDLQVSKQMQCVLLFFFP